jgi:uncharacterized protein (DUF488 family)
MLYTYGYLAGALADLERYAAEGALILDIRINPTSRNPLYRQGHLKRVLGEAYHWCPELGNPNYKSGGPPALADETAGMAALETLADRQPVVMLCACRDWRECHRRLAAEAFVARHPEAEVRHLALDEKLEVR